ncbi:MAG: PilN domain-containing protein [Armatimonadetes bacterium]|nr:PilN domain-containing protein [Armatimonadota bacterium]
MSTGIRVLEWSPNGVRMYDPTSKSVSEYESIAEAGRQTGGGPIVLAVSRRSSFFKRIPLPNASRGDLRRLIEMRAASTFPLPVEELAIDFLPTDQMSSEGRETLVVAIRGTDLQKALDEAKSAGFQVQKTVPTAFGSPFLAAEHGDAEALVVEKTPEGLSIDAVKDGSLVASRVALSGTDPHDEATRTAKIAGFQPDARVIGALNGVPPIHASAYGSPLAALAQYAISRIEIDLETNESRAKRDKASLAGMNRLAVLLALAAVALVAVVANDYMEAKGRVDKRKSKANVAVNKLKNLQKAVESDLVKENSALQALRRAMQPAQSMTDVVTSTSNATGSGAWLTAVSVERGKPMAIRGVAKSSDDVSRFLANLAKSPRFRDTKLVFSNNSKIGATPVVQFSVATFPVGNLPLVEAKKK